MYFLRSSNDSSKSGAKEFGEQLCSPFGTDHVLSFPYAIPTPGEYRMWVQARIVGQVLTDAFVIHVQ